VIPFRSSAELIDRLELSSATRALLIAVPPELEAIVSGEGAPAIPIESVAARAIRSVKEGFDFILLWQEDRVGSRSTLAAASKRLLAGGRLWVVTAMRKVQGPRTPAVHRLGLEDLKKAFTKDGMLCDREIRISAWHTAYRFVRTDPLDSLGR
jgi:hypothetical protein